MDHNTQIQQCLDELANGDTTAWQRLVPLVYEPLRQQAHVVFRSESSTLTATALLHEALGDLLAADLHTLKFEGPARFFALASRMMRNRLVDHLRKRRAIKRGGERAILSLDAVRGGDPAATTFDPLKPLHRAEEAERVHELLDELRVYDGRLWMLTELKIFCGRTNPEIAEALGISVKTVESDWTFAKSWLRQRFDATLETR